MKKLIIFLAFAFGCLFPLALGRTADATAQDEGGPVHVCVAPDGVMRIVPFSATCPEGQRSVILQKADSTVDLDQEKEKKGEGSSSIDKTILNDLNRRASKLENMDCASIGKSKVVAPFEVMDRTGKRVFLVDSDVVRLFNGSGKAVAQMLADRAGGLFTAEGSNTKVFLGINDPELAGFGVSENTKRRIALGENLGTQNYSLRFLSASSQLLAAIGVSGENDAGLATVADQAGKTRATIGLTKSGTGLIEIIGGNAIAQLTEGTVNHGGKLWIGNNGGVGMVEAGDAGGYGIVRAGPLGFEFIPTPGLALPGSVIVGKR